MSHLLEEYAKNIGVKINKKPVIMEHYWPIPFDKYIVINIGAEVSSKKYKHFGLALDMLSSTLNRHGVSIVQIGTSTDAKLSNVSLRLVDLHPRQIAYIIGKSSLYLGSDCVWSHYANSKDVPIVTLHGNAYAGISKGFWSDKQRNIEGEWEVCPSLSGTDPLENINKIKPEKICFACCELLEIPYKNSLNTVHIGPTFGDPVIEIIPNGSPHQKIDGEFPYFLRADFADGLFLDEWMRYLPKFSIFVNEKIDISLLEKYQSKINSILLEVSDNTEVIENCAKRLSKLTSNLVLISANDKIAKTRNNFFDYKVLPKRLDDVFKLSFGSNLFLASSKIVIDKNGQYVSLFHWKKKQFSDGKLLPLLNDPELLAEMEHFAVFEKRA